MKTIVSISFCATHHKGADPDVAWRLPGQEHWEWLEQACDLYLSLGLPVIVAATGFPGMLDVEVRPGNLERDVAWRVFSKTRAIVGHAHNPGHQGGAATCIRLGLECASKLGYDLLIHTAEDVVPQRHAVADMIDALDALGNDYAGSIWGPARDQRNAQFFGCRVQALVGAWDAGKVGSFGCIESYLEHLLRDKVQWHSDNLYRSTHDHSVWNQWRAEEYG